MANVSLSVQNRQTKVLRRMLCGNPDAADDDQVCPKSVFCGRNHKTTLLDDWRMESFGLWSSWSWYSTPSIHCSPAEKSWNHCEFTWNNFSSIKWGAFSRWWLSETTCLYTARSGIWAKWPSERRALLFKTKKVDPNKFSHVTPESTFSKNYVFSQKSSLALPVCKFVWVYFFRILLY